MGAEASLDLALETPDGCGACADRLRAGIGAHRGVLAVEVGDRTNRVVVRIDAEHCSAMCLDQTVLQLRRTLEDTYAHEVVEVEGMDCADCARTIERAVARVPGVSQVSVGFPSGAMRVEFRRAQVDAQRIHAQVTKLGYRVPGSGTHEPARRWPSRAWVTMTGALLTVLAVVIGLVSDRAALPVYLTALLLAGVPIARAGLEALIATRRPEIRLLMTIAVIGAAAIGAWLEAALVVVLFSLGEILEGRAAERARRELASLVDLTPATARVRRSRGDGPFAVFTEAEVPVAELALADVVVVRPGERIPVDGTVRDGAGAVDQAAITGESVPVDVSPGASVFAGTLNRQGLLLIEATRAPGDTTLDRIAALVTEAQARRSPSERWVDGFARRYTPAVIGLAVAVAVLSPLLLGVGWGTAFYDALALLILACPCALVLSTPVTIASALARASAAGVLIKGGAHLEAAAVIRTVAFDKTGTITSGRPAVTSVHVAPDTSETQVLALAAAVEHGSEHPLAVAITQAARRRGIRVPSASAFQALTGMGATGVVDGLPVTVGDPRLVGPLPGGLAATVDRLRGNGQTVVVVGVDGRAAGVVAIADTIRPEAAEAVAALHVMDVRTVMLTGDNPVTAAGVAAQVGVGSVHAGLLPAQKAAYVESCAAPAMIGDGVNDAPALAAASVGVAMGTAGSDTALEVADVAVMGDDLRKVPGLIGLARWARVVVRQNIWVSLLTKAAAAALLAGGALPLWGAVIADAGASLIVVGNGLRVVRGRPVTGAARHTAMLTPTPCPAPDVDAVRSHEHGDACGGCTTH